MTKRYGMDKLRNLEKLVEERRAWRAEGKTVVWTNGCFDLFHAGHVRALQVAKSFGDILVVGLNSDRSVHELKGAGRPICDETDRVAVLAEMESVDRVVVFDSKRCHHELAALQPDVWAKSGDYSPESLDADERDAVLRSGGRIAITPLIEGVSTTLLVKKIRRSDPEKIVSAACAFLRNPDGEILLVASRYTDAIKWSLPGGGHNTGETLPETARREMREETGIDVDIVGYMGVIERLEPSWGLHLNLHVFQAVPRDESVWARRDFPVLPDQDVVAAAWFSPERLQKESATVLGRNLWLTHGQDPASWPSYIFLQPGEE